MIKSYVLRSGRFTDAQKKAYESGAGGGKFTVAAQGSAFCFEEMFGGSGPVTLEIGFGMGIATAQIAQGSPEKNYLGIEVHKPGIGRLLREIEKRDLSNVRIVEGDAAEVVEKMIPPASLAAVHIFFPDPWPKKKHHKRRLLRRPFTEALAARLSPGGYLYMVTDWEDYAEAALAELGLTAGLRNAYDGFAQAQSWRPSTEFERKGLRKGHVIRELFFVKSAVG